MQFSAILPHVSHGGSESAPSTVGASDSSLSTPESRSSAGGFPTLLHACRGSGACGNATDIADDTSPENPGAPVEGLTDPALALALALSGNTLPISQPTQLADSDETVGSTPVAEDSVSAATLVALAQAASSEGQGPAQSVVAAGSENSPAAVKPVPVPTVSSTAGIPTTSTTIPDEPALAGLTRPADVGTSTTAQEVSAQSDQPGSSLPAKEQNGSARTGQAHTPTDARLVQQTDMRPMENAASQQVGETNANDTGVKEEPTLHRMSANRAAQAELHDLGLNSQQRDQKGAPIGNGTSDSSSHPTSFVTQAESRRGETNEDTSRSFQHESFSSQAGHAPQTHDTSTAVLYSGQAAAVSRIAPGGSASPADPATPTSADATANVTRADHETPGAPPVHAVQFDLPPTDLGRLRVRVVLSDQTVHTYMTTDRAELGQLLSSRQDQLGTQLSASGLDMGQFRVQVDHHGANHSGQERLSRAYDDTLQQQRGHRQQERPPGSPVPDRERTGMLSLFA